jgi:hypothetical protein
MTKYLRPNSILVAVLLAVAPAAPALADDEYNVSKG